MLQLIEHTHTQNHLDWRMAYGTSAVHRCHSLGTTGTELRMSMRYKGNTSACSDDVHLAGVSKLRVVDDAVLSSCCVGCCHCCWPSSSASLASNKTSNAVMCVLRLRHKETDAWNMIQSCSARRMLQYKHHFGCCISVVDAIF